ALRRPAPIRRSAAPYLKAAAIIAGVGIGVWAGRHQLASLIEGPPRPVEFSTTRGHTLRARLPDSSQVVLAPESRLAYTASLRGDRQLSLVGQAYFEVVHDPHRAFVVHAGNALTTDLGTHFAVRAYPSESQVTVAVADGSVQISNASRGDARVLSA